MSKIDELIAKRKKAHAALLRSGSKVYAGFLDMERAAFSPGSLEALHKELIAVGISVAIHCDSCMQ